MRHTQPCHIAPRRAGLVCSRSMRRRLIAFVSLLPFAASAQPDPAAASAPSESSTSGSTTSESTSGKSAAPAAPAVAREMGTVRLEGGPVGVPVFIDGEAAGISPLPGPWTLTAGAHSVELRPAGASPIVRAVQVEAGREVRVVLGAVSAARPQLVEPEGAADGVASGGAAGPGVSLGLMADGLAADALAVQPPEGTRAEQMKLVDDADAAAFWANVAYGAGGVLVVSGVAMALLASDGPLGDAPVSVVPTAGGAVVVGSF